MKKEIKEMPTSTNAKVTAENAVAKFEEGKMYYYLCGGDGSIYDCKVTYIVTKRTSKTVTLEDEAHRVKTFKINLIDEAKNTYSEYVKPLGNYSMAPTLRASKVMSDDEADAYKCYLALREADYDAQIADLFDDDEDEEDEELAQVDESNVAEDDGSNDDAEEENFALTVDYNFDEDDSDDELVDEAQNITLWWGVNKNCNSGVYTSYAKEFKTKKAAFKFFLKKRGSYKGTTATYFHIDVDDEEVFFWDSAARDYGLKINDAEIQNLYDEWQFEERVNTFFSECASYVELAKNHPELLEKSVAFETERRKARAKNFARTTLKKIFKDAKKAEEAVAQEVIAAEENSEPISTIDTIGTENVITTADLEAELAAVQVEIADNLFEIEDKKATKLAHYQHLIIEYIANILKCEDCIAKMTVELLEKENKVAELGEKAAALEAEINNRKMIEAMEYITVTAEAFNASIQAEEEAAYSVKAIENLVTAAENAAIMEVEVAPVKFAIERFNEDNAEIIIAENAATIDTAVTATEIPIVDVDAEEEKLLEEYEALDAEIAELETKLSAMYKARFEVKCKLGEIHTERHIAAIKNIRKILGSACKNGAIIELHAQDNEYYWFADEYWNRIYCSIDYRGRLSLNYEDKEIAFYSDAEKFKAVISELAAAIERGDEVYTFPPDDANNTAKA